MSEYLKTIVDAFKRPTQKQKEAYARYLHTISAAGLGVKLAALAFSTLITFIVGAILAKGETAGDSK